MYCSSTKRVPWSLWQKAGNCYLSLFNIMKVWTLKELSFGNFSVFKLFLDIIMLICSLYMVPYGVCFLCKGTWFFFNFNCWGSIDRCTRQQYGIFKYWWNNFRVDQNIMVLWSLHGAQREQGFFHICHFSDFC